MRIAIACLVGVVSCSAIACSAPEPTKTTYRAGSSTGKPTKGGGTSSGDLTPEPGVDDPDPEPTPGPPATTPADADGDGIPDTQDCDPASAALAGTKLLDDDLATDKGFFTTADGFPQASWSHDGTAYRQVRVADAADTSVFNKDPAIGDVVVEVKSASTEISGAITPRLRQMFIVLGAAVSAGQLSAIGCGVEVAQGEATEQKTSIVRLAGPPGSVTTTVVQRVNRAPLSLNEEFSIKARLALGTLTCDVTQAGTTTTATASNLGTIKGSVGFFTRQTKALFKQARICKLK